MSELEHSSSLQSQEKPTLKVVGFVCDWSVDLKGALTEDGRLREVPNVYVMMIPCSGFIRPSWLEFALKNGADGVFVCGCPYGDCLNREGNFLIRNRIQQMRRRLQRQRIDPERVTMLAYGLHDREGFLLAIKAFLEDLRRRVVPGGQAVTRAAQQSSPNEIS
ncbi:MAG: hydrogenase iron-sulfur subunit [Armatimonadota bacterium]|nr:hydrogenase iron-sulfur subunit [Armatimonadota bacterium]